MGEEKRNEFRCHCDWIVCYIILLIISRLWAHCVLIQTANSIFSLSVCQPECRINNSLFPDTSNANQQVKSHSMENKTLIAPRTASSQYFFADTISTASNAIFNQTFQWKMWIHYVQAYREQQIRKISRNWSMEIIALDHISRFFSSEEWNGDVISNVWIPVRLRKGQILYEDRQMWEFSVWT